MSSRLFDTSPVLLWTCSSESSGLGSDDYQRTVHFFSIPSTGDSTETGLDFSHVQMMHADSDFSESEESNDSSNDDETEMNPVNETEDERESCGEGGKKSGSFQLDVGSLVPNYSSSASVSRARVEDPGVVVRDFMSYDGNFRLSGALSRGFRSISAACCFSMRSRKPFDPTDFSGPLFPDPSAGPVAPPRPRERHPAPAVDRVFVLGSPQGKIHFCRFRVYATRPSGERHLQIHCHPIMTSLPVVDAPRGMDVSVRQLESFRLSKFGVVGGSEYERVVYARSDLFLRVWLLEPEAANPIQHQQQGHQQRRQFAPSFGRALRHGRQGGSHDYRGAFTRGPNVHSNTRSIFWTLPSRIKYVAPFSGCGERVCLVLDEQRDHERNALQVVDFAKLLEPGSLRRRPSSKLPDVVWKREKGPDQERACYECAVAGAGILGGMSSSASVFAAAGFGYPEAFRSAQKHVGGPLIDVFDIRSGEEPVVQVYAAYDTEPFNSLVRVRTTSGWGLLTTTRHGRVQLWDLRMLRNQNESQSRCDGSEPIGDWSIFLRAMHHQLFYEPIPTLRRTYCARPKVREWIPDPGQQGSVVVNTPPFLQDLEKCYPQRCEARAVDSGGDSVLIATPDALYRWSDFGAEAPLVEEFMHSYHLGPQFCRMGKENCYRAEDFCCVGCLHVDDEDEEETFPSPLPVEVDDVRSKKVGAVVSLLEDFSDFELRPADGRIKTFQSFFLDSRYASMILQKHSAQIQWDLPSLNEEDLLRFLVGIPGALAAESLLDYYVLFFGLGMVGRCFLVCLQAESLDRAELLVSLLGDARDLLPRVLGGRNSKKAWDRSPFVRALLNSLKALDQTTRDRALASESYDFVRELLLRPAVPVFRLKVFRRVKSVTSESLLRKSFSFLADQSPPTGNTILKLETDERRVHGECLAYTSDFFRALFSFGGQDAVGDRSYDVSETFATMNGLNTYVYYTYTGALPEEVGVATLFEILGISDRTLDPELTRTCLDVILARSRELSEEGRFKVFLLEKGHFFFRVGREWIQRELLACWSSFGEDEDEVLRLIRRSMKLSGEEED